MTSREIRKSALESARGKGGKLGWLDVFELSMQFARKNGSASEPPLDLSPSEAAFWKPEKFDAGTLPDPKAMQIAMEGAKELKGLAVPRMTSKHVDDEEARKKKAMVIPDTSQYLPEDTEEL